MAIFIIIPAYNEEKNIGRVLSGLFRHGYKEVIVVDDGSTDNTAAIAQNSGALVLRHSINRGQGAALQTGNDYVKTRILERVSDTAKSPAAVAEDIIVHFDGDNQFDARDIMTAIKELKEKNLDIILGSRFLNKDNSGRLLASNLPLTKKYLLLPIARYFNYICTGLKLTDAHNGFRVFTAATLSSLQITHERMSHNTEIIKQIKKYNLKFKEWPVSVIYHCYGQGLFSGLRILWDILLHRYI